MDKTLIELSTPTQATVQYAPDLFESGLGLWLDRTGQARDGRKYPVLRVLNNYGILEILEGTGWFYSTPTGWRKIRAGECVWLYPEIPHFYQAETEWHTQWIVFNGPWIEQLRKLGYIQPVVPFFESVTFISDAFYSLQNKNTIDPSSRALTNFNALTNLLSGVLLKTSRQERHSHPLAEKILRYVRENSRLPLSPPEIATKFKISHSHMRKIFKEYTGVSLKQFIMHERITNAKALLIDTSLPPKLIAELVGYEDYLYFMRIFKQHTGSTVGEFRTTAVDVSQNEI